MNRNCRNTFYNRKWFYLSLLTFLWFLFAFLVNPSGEFPLNDDWAYAKNVYYLVVCHLFKFTNWPAMTLIAQTLWGTIFCGIFGFSFTTLRLSVLILGWAGVITLFLLIRKFLLNDFSSFLFALILALNPLYFCLSYTFMTEIPFLVSILVALYFYSCYYKDQKLRNLILATGFALIATMIRQLGIWIAITMILTYLFTGRINLKRLLFYTFLAGLIFTIFYSFTAYLRITKSLPAFYASFNDLLHSFNLNVILKNLYFRGSLLLFCSGFFLLPVLVYIFPSSWKSLKPVSRWIVASVAALFSIPVYLNLKFIPDGNIFYNLGLGPKLVKDAFWGFNIHPVMSPHMMQAFHAIGTIGAVFLAFALIISFIRITGIDRNTQEKKVKVQILLLFAGYLGFLLLFPCFFDRYLLPFILFFILLLAAPDINVYVWNKVISLILLLILAFFSISATHDYLSFNRARWDGLNNLLSKGISPKNIDGGFEFNGWYETGELTPLAIQNKSWWWVNDDTYMLSLGNMCGYRKIEAHQYFSFLTFSRDSVLTLKRDSHYNDSIVLTCGAEVLSKNKDFFVTSDKNLLIETYATCTDEEAHSGKNSILLDKREHFGFPFHFRDAQPCEKFRISVWCKGNQDQKAGIIVTGPKAELLYRWANIPKAKAGDWQLLETEVLLYMGYPSSELFVLLRNCGDNKVYFDDMRIVRYRNPDF